MFGKWTIPSNVCDTRPIARDSADLFIGHEALISQVRRSLDHHSIVLIEGEIGRGKTSIGNVCRMSSQRYLSPDIELQSEPSWSRQHFLRCVISSLIIAIENHPETKRLKNSDLIKHLKAINHPQADENQLLHELHRFEEHLNTEAFGNIDGIVMQMNNLDIAEVFKPDQLEKLLNSIRDALQVPKISWILCGHEGITAFMRKKVRRLHDIITTKIMLNPLSGEEVIEVLQIRIKKQYPDEDPIFPMDPQLIKAIYELCNASLRETFSVLNELLMAFADDPLVTTITLNDACKFYKNQGIDDCLSTREREVMTLILDRPQSTQKELMQHIDIEQSALSKYTHDLEDKGLIRKARKAQSFIHHPAVRMVLGHGKLTLPA